MRTKTLHFKPVNISRNKARPDNAVKACAYRSGQALYDEKEKATHNYSNRRGVIETGIFSPEESPEWMADDDQQRVWERFGNEIEKAEDGHNRRASAMLGKDFQIAAPRELTQEQNWGLAQKFAEKFNEKGLAVAVAFHETEASDGQTNPHFHFFAPMREVNEDGFGKRYRTLDAPGKGKENPELMGMRRDYYRLVNEALADAGVKNVYYDPEKQEDVEPGIHLGKEASAREKKGEKSYLADYNRKLAYNNFMRYYEKSAQEARESSDGWAFLPPTVEQENWHKRFAEWQLQRGSMMAARDAAQKSQASIATPPATRSQNRTEMARQQAALSTRQTWAQRVRDEQREQAKTER